MFWLEKTVPRVAAFAITVLAARFACGEADKLLDRLMDKLTVPSSKRTQKPYQWHHCRTAPHGCRERVEAFASYFRAAGDSFGVDPYLLASMAWQESRLNPWARGQGGELGILQIHPARRDAKQLAIYDEKARKRCQKQVGACQADVVMTAASILHRAMQKCGDLALALGMYNTGKCQETGYSRRVLGTWRELRGVA